MKFILLFLLLNSSAVAYARGINPSTQNLGGVSDNFDPNSSINKKGPTRSEMERALRMMAEAGYGPKTPKNKQPERSADGRR